MIYWINSIRPTDELRIIEIGSYTGESTLMFAKHFKEVMPSFSRKLYMYCSGPVD